MILEIRLARMISGSKEDFGRVLHVADRPPDEFGHVVNTDLIFPPLWTSNTR
jgi:hypothetical protein